MLSGSFKLLIMCAVVCAGMASRVGKGGMSCGGCLCLSLQVIILRLIIIHHHSPLNSPLLPFSLIARYNLTVHFSNSSFFHDPFSFHLPSVLFRSSFFVLHLCFFFFISAFFCSAFFCSAFFFVLSSLLFFCLLFSFHPSEISD